MERDEFMIWASGARASPAASRNSASDGSVEQEDSTTPTQEQYPSVNYTQGSASWHAPGAGVNLEMAFSAGASPRQQRVAFASSAQPSPIKSPVITGHEQVKSTRSPRSPGVSSTAQEGRAPVPSPHQSPTEADRRGAAPNTVTVTAGSFSMSPRSPRTSTLTNETDLNFGPHRITVSAPVMSHQRVDLYPDGTITTSSRPISSEQPSSARDDLLAASTNFSEKSSSGSHNPSMAGSSPTKTAPLSAAPVPLPQAVPIQPQPPAQDQRLSPSRAADLLAPANYPPLPAMSPPTGPQRSYSPIQHAQPSTLPELGAHTRRSLEQAQMERERHMHTPPPLQQKPDSSRSQYHTLRSTMPYARTPYEKSPYGNTSQQYGAMATPVPGATAWLASPAATPSAVGTPADAAAGTSLATLQAFGSDQAPSPREANARQRATDTQPSPSEHQPTLQQHPQHSRLSSPQVLPSPSVRPPQPSVRRTDRNAQENSGAAHTGSNNTPRSDPGQPLQGVAGGPAGLTPSSSSSRALQGAGGGGGATPSGDSYDSPMDQLQLRVKYRKNKQLLQESVKEIDTLRGRLMSEGRRAGVLAAQVAALQNQVELAGDNMSLLATTQAEKMAAMQKLREAREGAETLQNQLSAAQNQIRALEQQQANMLNEFAAERQRREAQFVEERQKLEAARTEGEAQRVAYLAAFHEDRGRWEAATAEQHRILQVDCEAKIANAKEEHARQLAATAADHNAALQAAKAEAQTATEMANLLAQRAKAEMQAASEAAAAAVKEARAQAQAAEAAATQHAKAEIQAANEAAEAAVRKAKAQAQEQVEAANVSMSEARRKHAVELEAARGRHAAELEEVRRQHAVELEEARGRHAGELEEVRARHARQLSEAEETANLKIGEAFELRARLSEVEAQRAAAVATSNAREEQLKGLEKSLHELESILRERDAELLSTQTNLATAKATIEGLHREAALRQQAHEQEVNVLQQALDETREASRRSAQANADYVARLAAAEAKLDEAVKREQERVQQAVRQAKEEHRLQLTGVVQQVHFDAQEQVRQVKSAASEVTEALTGEMEAHLAATRRDIERVGDLLESRSSEVQALKTSLDLVAAERDKLLGTNSELQDTVAKLQQRIEKQEKKHAKALERAHAHREQQVARLHEELEAIRASVPARVERALQSYAAQLAPNQQAAMAAVEARASAALASERAAAEAAVKRIREEVERESQQRLAAQQGQAEEQRRRLEARADAAETAASAVRVRAQELEGVVKALSEAEASARKALAEAERQSDARRSTAQDLERQLNETRRLLEAARSRSEQLQGVYSVLGQLGLPVPAIEAVAAAAMAAASAASSATTTPAASSARSWLLTSLAPSSLTASPTPLRTTNTNTNATNSTSTAAAIAAAVAGHTGPASLPALLSALRDQIATALLPPQLPQPAQQIPTQQAPTTPSGRVRSEVDDGEVRELRRRLQEARAEALVYRQKIEASVQRERQRAQHEQEMLDKAAVARKGGEGRRYDWSRSVTRSQLHKSRRHHSWAAMEAEMGRHGHGFVSDGDLGLDLDPDFDDLEDPDVGFVADHRRAVDTGMGGARSRGRRRLVDMYNDDDDVLHGDFDLDPVMSYSDGDAAAAPGRTGRYLRPTGRSAARPSGLYESAIDPTGPRAAEPYIRQPANRRHPRPMGGGERGRRGDDSSDGGGGGGGRGGGGGGGKVLGGTAAALHTRVQQLVSELQSARARGERCLEAARRADEVLLLLHGAASRAQLLLAGAPRQADQDLSDELSEALARASRHRQCIARLQAEAEAQHLPGVRQQRAGEVASPGGFGASGGIMRNGAAQAKELEQQQAAVAAMAEQLEAARGQVAEAVAAVDGMRTQLLQQTDAHTAELAAARGAAEAAMAQVAQLSTQLIDARSSQQMQLQEAQALKRQQRGYGQQVQQLMDDLSQRVAQTDLQNLAQQVLSSTERAMGLWTIREHDSIQSYRRAVAGLRREAGECMHLLQALTASQLQSISQLAARSREMAAEVARLREQGAHDTAALQQKHEELQQARDAHQRVREDLEGRLQSMAQTVRVVEAQRDEAQAAAERALSLADERSKELDQAKSDLETERQRGETALTELDQRHESALAQLREAYGAAALDSDRQMDAVTKRAHDLSARLEEQDMAVQQLREAMAGLRVALRDTQDQLEEAQTARHMALQRAQLSEAAEAHAREQLGEMQSQRWAAVEEAARLRDEVARVGEQLMAAMETAKVAEAEVAMLQAEARELREVAEAAQEDARAADAEATRIIGEVQGLRELAEAAQEAARSAEVEAAKAWAEAHAQRELCEAAEDVARAAEAEAARACADAEAQRVVAEVANEAADAEVSRLRAEVRTQRKHAAVENARSVTEAQAQRAAAEAANEAARVAMEEVARARAEAQAQAERAEAAQKAAEEARAETARAWAEVQAAKEAAKAAEAELAAAREGLRQAEARAKRAEEEQERAEKAAAGRLEQAHAMVLEARQAARVASGEQQVAQRRAEELQAELLSLELRLDAARSAASMHEQQLLEEQEESDRLRTHLRASQARMYELRQTAAVMGVPITGSSTGGARSPGGGEHTDPSTLGFDVTGGSRERFLFTEEASLVRRCASGSASPASERRMVGARGDGGGGSRALSPEPSCSSIPAASVTPTEGAASPGQVIQLAAPMPALQAVQSEFFLSSPASQPTSPPQQLGLLLLMTQKGLSPQRQQQQQQPVLPALPALAQPQQGQGLQLQASPARQVPQSPEHSPGRHHSSQPAEQQRNEKAEQSGLHIRALLAEVSQHCQRLPAINQLLDQLLLPQSDNLENSASDGGAMEAAGSMERRRSCDSYGGSTPCDGRDGSVNDSAANRPGGDELGARNNRNSGGGSAVSGVASDSSSGATLADGVHADFWQSPAAATALEHMVSVLDGALQLVSKLEKSTVKGVPEQQPAGESAELALRQQRHKLEETWCRVSEARRRVTSCAGSLASAGHGTTSSSRTATSSSGGGGSSGGGSIPTGDDKLLRRSVGCESIDDVHCASKSPVDDSTIPPVNPKSEPNPNASQHDASELAREVQSSAKQPLPSLASPTGTFASAPSGVEGRAESALSAPAALLVDPIVDQKPSGTVPTVPMLNTMYAAANAADLKTQGAQSSTHLPEQAAPTTFATAGTAAIGDPPRNEPADAAPCFRGFPVPTAAVTTPPPAADRAPAPERTSIADREAVVAATKAVELARALSPLYNPPNLQLVPAQPPLSPTQWQGESLQQTFAAPASKLHKPRLTLADLMAPREGDPESGTATMSGAQWPLSSAGQSPIRAELPASHTPSPEPQPRPPLNLPHMPLAPMSLVSAPLNAPEPSAPLHPPSQQWPPQYPPEQPPAPQRSWVPGWEPAPADNCPSPERRRKGRWEVDREQLQERLRKLRMWSSPSQDVQQSEEGMVVTARDLAQLEPPPPPPAPRGSDAREMMMGANGNSGRGSNGIEGLPSGVGRFEDLRCSSSSSISLAQNKGRNTSSGGIPPSRFEALPALEKLITSTSTTGYMGAATAGSQYRSLNSAAADVNAASVPLTTAMAPQSTAPAVPSYSHAAAQPQPQANHQPSLRPYIAQYNFTYDVQRATSPRHLPATDRPSITPSRPGRYSSPPPPSSTDLLRVTPGTLGSTLLGSDVMSSPMIQRDGLSTRDTPSESTLEGKAPSALEALRRSLNVMLSEPADATSYQPNQLYGAAAAKLWASSGQSVRASEGDTGAVGGSQHIASALSTYNLASLAAYTAATGNRTASGGRESAGSTVSGSGSGGTSMYGPRRNTPHGGGGGGGADGSSSASSSSGAGGGDGVGTPGGVSIGSSGPGRRSKSPGTRPRGGATTTGAAGDVGAEGGIGMQGAEGGARLVPRSSDVRRGYAALHLGRMSGSSSGGGGSGN